MKKTTVNDMLNTYLEEMEFDETEKKKIIKNFHEGVKKVKKEGEEEIRHGTTCFGVISKKKDKVRFEC